LHEEINEIKAEINAIKQKLQDLLDLKDVVISENGSSPPTPVPMVVQAPLPPVKEIVIIFLLIIY